MRAGSVLKGGRDELAQAGELLAVEAIDRTGLIVTSEGAFVRIFRVVPPNPLLMSQRGAREDRRRLRAARHAAQGAGDAADLRRRATGEPRRSCWPRAAARCRPARGRRRAASSRARPDGAGAVAAVRGDGGVAAAARRRAGRGAGVRVRGRAATCRARPPPGRRWRGRKRNRLRAARARARAAGAPAGGAREPRARRRAARRARGRRDANRPARRRSGAASAVGAVQPDQGRQRAPPARRRRGGAGRARRAARPRRRPRRGAAAEGADRRSSLDFRASHHQVTVDRDLEQTIFGHNTAGRTSMGWLHGRDAHPPAVHAERVRARARPPPRAPEAQARPTGGCSRSTAAPSNAAACPTSTATSRNASTSSCWARWPPASTPTCSASRSTRRSAPAAPART